MINFQHLEESNLGNYRKSDLIPNMRTLELPLELPYQSISLQGENKPFICSRYFVAVTPNYLYRILNCRNVNFVLSEFH